MYLGIRLFRSIGADRDVSISEHKSFWLISLGVIAVWALFSGIGGFSYQTGDYTVRNPMFRDLCRYPWPVYYDFDKQPEFARSVIGTAASGTYVYYFAWWLPVAAFMKLTHCSEAVGQTTLYIWTVLELFLAFYFLVRYMRKYSYWILSAFVLFAGLDIVAWLACNVSIPNDTHIEWWVGFKYFQYSSNTTQLYWVFNQSVPIWLIVSILLQLKDSKSSAALCSLSFAYSPFATIGMIPIAIASAFNYRSEGANCSIWKKARNMITFENVAVPLAMLIVFGSFYLQNKNSLGETGFIFQIYPERRTLALYVIFCLVEFVIFFVAVGMSAARYRFYWVTLAELLLIPLYYAGGNNDFCMRASIPALMLLMVIMLQYIHEDVSAPKEKKRQKVVMALLLVGYFTSVTEIQRNVKGTLMLQQSDYLRESVYSFGEMKTDNESQIRLNIKQYIPTDYQDSFFYKYLAERGYQ